MLAGVEPRIFSTGKGRGCEHGKGKTVLALPPPVPSATLPFSAPTHPVLLFFYPKSQTKFFRSSVWCPASLVSKGVLLQLCSLRGERIPGPCDLKRGLFPPASRFFPFLPPKATRPPPLRHPHQSQVLYIRCLPFDFFLLVVIFYSINKSASSASASSHKPPPLPPPLPPNTALTLHLRTFNTLLTRDTLFKPRGRRD